RLGLQECVRVCHRLHPDGQRARRLGYRGRSLPDPAGKYDRLGGCHERRFRVLVRADRVPGCRPCPLSPLRGGIEGRPSPRYSGWIDPSDVFPFQARPAPRIGVHIMSGQLRRLPIYLLLDCSESMAGEAIADLERGVETMVTVLRGDPQALESAYL